MLEELLADRFTAALTAITNANPNQPRGNPANSGQFAKTPGGSRPREPETKGTKDRYGEANPAKLNTNPDLNEERARAALEEVMQKEKGYVDKAAYRAETGWIRFDHGDPGDPTPDATGRTHKGGHGISHILAKHPDDAKHLPDVIARGSVHKHEDPAKLYVATDTHFAVLGPLSKGHKRVITEFEPAKAREIMEIKKRPRAKRPGAN